MDESAVQLAQSNEIIDLYGNIQNANIDMVVKSVETLKFPINGELRNNEMCFYKVKQLSFDEDYPRREAFENVLLSMDNQAFNFVYVLTGTEEGIELCVGVVKNQNENAAVLGKKLSAVNYGEIVANVFEGNFNGSVLEKMNGSELDKLVGGGLQNYKNAGVIIGIPSVNEKDGKEEYDFQGIDRLVNSMLGLEWRLVIVCEPVSKRKFWKSGKMYTNCIIDYHFMLSEQFSIQKMLVAHYRLEQVSLSQRGKTGGIVKLKENQRISTGKPGGQEVILMNKIVRGRAGIVKKGIIKDSV